MNRRSRQLSQHWSGVATLIIGLALASIVVKAARDQFGEREAPDDYGTPIAAAELPAIDLPPHAPPVAVHTGCAIQRFGVAPWHLPGTARTIDWFAATRVALMRMGLPPDVAADATRALAESSPDDTVGIGNAGGIATRSRQTYMPAFSTTFQHNGQRVVCHATRVAFANPERLEYARLFLFEHAGQTFHIAEFLACNNVTRLFPTPPAPPTGEPPGPATPSYPAADPSSSAPERTQPVRINTVDEPGTLWLAMLAAAGLLVLRRPL